jgi:hypothetical protein
MRRRILTLQLPHLREARRHCPPSTAARCGDLQDQERAAGGPCLSRAAQVVQASPNAVHVLDGRLGTVACAGAKEGVAESGTASAARAVNAQWLPVCAAAECEPCSSWPEFSACKAAGSATP